MSDHQKPDGNKAPSKPSHIAYQVRDGGEGKSYFNRVGSAFAHGDGKGFNVILDSTPVDGKVTLRTPQDRLNAKANETQAKPNQDRER